MAGVVDRAAYFKRIGYQPHREQLLFHNSHARFRVPVCGRRFGKSKMAGTDVQPKLLLPKKMYWIVGPTYDLGEKEFRVVWDDMIIKQQLGRDKGVKKGYNKKQGVMFMEFPWQTRIEVRSADHPDNLVGEALDGVIMSEAAKHKKETWERFIRPALSDKRGFADFPTTPEGFNWLHDIWQLGKNAKFPNYESWKFPSWANDVVYPGGYNDPEIQELIQTTTPEWFAQEYGADFASFVGKILPEWDENIHVENHTFRPDWPNFMAFDFGYTNPLAAVEFQISPQDEVFVWREHYKSFTTIPDHVRMLKARENPDGYHLDLAFGDPADPEAAAMVSRLLVQCFTNPKVKSEYTWADGIDLMREFMKPIPTGEEVDEYGTPAPDRPRYHVDPACAWHIKECNNYRSPEPLKGRNVPEFATKMEDHTIDAMRYALIYIYKYGARSSLADIYRPSARPAGASRQSGSALTSVNSSVSLNNDVGTGGHSSGFGSVGGMEF
jgi:hypothetical protein